MSLTKNRRIRCDWCGKLTSDQLGHYLKADGVNYGRIVQPEWERFPGGDETSANQIQSDHDICEECAAGHCPGCGSDQIVNVTPATPGPDGFGGRCKACGYQWAMPTSPTGVN
jgi:hypothetical protein